MGKRDLKKEWPHLYKPSAKKIVTVDVPEMNFLMIDGEGDPNISNDFQQAVEGLFGISYTLKFMIKKQEIDMGIKEQLDYAVMPLEGLWWADDPNDFLNGVKKGVVKKRSARTVQNEVQKLYRRYVCPGFIYRTVFQRGSDNPKHTQIYNRKRRQSLRQTS